MVNNQYYIKIIWFDNFFYLLKNNLLTYIKFTVLLLSLIGLLYIFKYIKYILYRYYLFTHHYLLNAIPCHWSHSFLFDATLFSEIKYVQFMCSKYCFFGRSFDFFPVTFPLNMLVMKSLYQMMSPINFIFLDSIIFIRCLFFLLLLTFAHCFYYLSILSLSFTSTSKSLLPPVCFCHSCPLSMLHCHMLIHSK